MSDTRVVVGIDFGTTYSGFAYAHKSNPKEISAHVDWQEYSGRFKTPTVLKYDKSLKFESWGFPALAKKPNKRSKSSDEKPAERFKLYLGDVKDKPPLPKGLEYKTAITDYLREMGKVLKETLKTRWQKLDYFKQVFIVMTVPAEFDNQAMGIMRECAFKAGIIKEKDSRNLKITTEPEAAAIYCLKKREEYDINVGSLFMIVDCGGGTVDLTTRKLLEGNQLDEITEREGDFCGGSYVDEEFLKFIGQKVGKLALDKVREDHYSQLQYMVQDFCRRVKTQFTGQESKFQPPEFDLKKLCPVLERYVKGQELDNMEEEDWTIELTYEEVKAMFDPVIERIISLIRKQLDKLDGDISAMLLVGGFSESKYLQLRIKQEFSNEKRNISVPLQPIVAVVKGAVQFGLDQEIVKTRVLKWTYGTDALKKWERGDPHNRRRANGKIMKFSRLAQRGTQVAANDKVVKKFTPTNGVQKRMGLDIYYTKKDDANFCDEPGVDKLDTWCVDLPATNQKRFVSFVLTFGSVEIEAVAQNPNTGEIMDETTFDLDI